MYPLFLINITVAPVKLTELVIIHREASNLIGFACMGVKFIFQIGILKDTESRRNNLKTQALILLGLRFPPLITYVSLLPLC